MVESRSHFLPKKPISDFCCLAPGFAPPFPLDASDFNFFGGLVSLLLLSAPFDGLFELAAGGNSSSVTSSHTCE